MLSISVGMRTYSPSDPLVNTIQDLIDEFDAMTGIQPFFTFTSFYHHFLGPCSNAVDFIKPLQFIPTHTRTRAQILSESMSQVYGGMVDQLKHKVMSGEDVPDCMAKDLLENKKEHLTQKDICMLVVAFAFGGVPSVSLSHTIRL